MGYLDRATDEAGYPAMDFETFYQHGVSCFVWGFPRSLVRRAFQRVCGDWKAEGKPVALWQMRAFAYGLSGHYAGGMHKRLARDGYQWPTPPDASWELVACIYPNGEFDLDLLHSVSCRFWSEDNGFFDPPTESPLLPLLMNQQWFEKMGFDVLRMQPLMRMKVAGTAPPHLTLVDPARSQP